MKIEYIKELIEIVEKSNINELKISYKGIWKVLGYRDVSIKKKYDNSNSKQIETIESKIEEEKPEYKEIKSPEVGTFYLKIKENDEIEKEQTLGYVKSMNLDTEIKSEYHGIVKKVLVENEEPIDYNQTLFLIEPLLI